MKVLSITTKISSLYALTISTTARMSTTSRSGFEGDSNQTIFVVGVRAFARFPRSEKSTKLISKPWCSMATSRKKLWVPKAKLKSNAENTASESPVVRRILNGKEFIVGCPSAVQKARKKPQCDEPPYFRIVTASAQYLGYSPLRPSPKTWHLLRPCPSNSASCRALITSQRTGTAPPIPRDPLLKGIRFDGDHLSICRALLHRQRPAKKSAAYLRRCCPPTLSGHRF